MVTQNSNCYLVEDSVPAENSPVILCKTPGCTDNHPQRHTQSVALNSEASTMTVALCATCEDMPVALALSCNALHAAVGCESSCEVPLFDEIYDFVKTVFEKSTCRSLMPESCSELRCFLEMNQLELDKPKCIQNLVVDGLFACSLPRGAQSSLNGFKSVEKDHGTDSAIHYSQWVFRHNRLREVSTTLSENLSPDSLNRRKKYIRFLAEAHKGLGLELETLFLAVNVLDRHKAWDSDPERLVQLCFHALHMAAKSEEGDGVWEELRALVCLRPTLAAELVVGMDFEKIKFDPELEWDIFRSSNCNLSYPSPLCFLKRMTLAEDHQSKTADRATYLLEVILAEPAFCHFKPSSLAAAAVYFTQLIHCQKRWTSFQEYLSGYRSHDLAPIVAEIFRTLTAHRANTNRGLQEYLQERYPSISENVNSWIETWDSPRPSPSKSSFGMCDTHTRLVSSLTVEPTPQFVAAGAEGSKKRRLW